MKIVILEKPGRFTARNFNSILENELREIKGDLSASARLDGFSPKGWTRIDISGEDSEIVSELLARKFSRAQPELAHLELLGVYEGIVVRYTKDGIEVDIGTDAPRPLSVKIGVESLCAQLTDGRPTSVDEITRDYCLFPGSRVSVRITQINPEEEFVEGWLSDSFLEQLSSWIRTSLDRIQVSDCFRQEVESAVRKLRIERDVVAIEPVTLTMQSVVSKLGTDGVGLIPKLGSVLRNRQLNPFIPKKIITRCRPW